MLNLGRVALLVLLHALELILQVFKFYIFLPGRLLNLTIHLVLDGLNTPSSPFFLFVDARLELRLLHFVEVPHLAELLR